MKALDLFCGAGGSSMGLHKAGFDITGIDIIEQLEYPFDFEQADVFNLSHNFIKQFDFIWASPPCQAYSFASRHFRNNGKKYIDLIKLVRNLLLKINKPFVIENVPGAPIRKDILLCGEMFGLKVVRHRYFEIHGFKVFQPKHQAHRGFVYKGYYVTVAGNGGNSHGHNYCRLNGIEYKSKLQIWQNAMQINWITDIKRLAQAVPPAYSEYIARQFLNYEILLN